MKRRELQGCLSSLAEQLGLRWIAKTRRFLGIHRGVVVEAWEWDGEIHFQFFSHSAQVGDQMLDDFRGFTHCAQAGLPTDWIRGSIEHDPDGRQRSSDHGCILSLDCNRIDLIGAETFNQIPDLVAQDYHLHGASETSPCIRCDNKAATTVALVNYGYSPMCDDCWYEVQFHSSGGKLPTDQSVNWMLVLPILAALTALGGLAWGFLLQPNQVEHLGWFFIILPAAWAFGLCSTMARIGRGVTRMLRLWIFASVATSVLAGNIWGFRSFLIQEVQKQLNQPVVGPGCIDSIRLYFAALADHWPSQIPLFLGAFVGVHVGLWRLKRKEIVALD